MQRKTNDSHHDFFVVLSESPSVTYALYRYATHSANAITSGVPQSAGARRSYRYRVFQYDVGATMAGLGIARNIPNAAKISA